MTARAEQAVQSALEANRAAYDALRGGLHVGMSELDAFEIVKKAVDGVCGTEDHEFIGDFVGGARSGSIEGQPTDYVFVDGDTFILDLSVRRGNFWSDTCRTFFFGEPDARKREAYAMVLECQALGERIVRAGMRCEDVKKEMESLLVSRGFGGKMPHHAGHCIGVKPYMKPAFEEDDGSILERGAVCTLEPGLYFEGEFGIRVENDYLVRETGLENLFEYPREIEAFILKGGVAQ